MGRYPIWISDQDSPSSDTNPDSWISFNSFFRHRALNFQLFLWCIFPNMFWRTKPLRSPRRSATGFLVYHAAAELRIDSTWALPGHRLTNNASDVHFCYAEQPENVQNDPDGQQKRKPQQTDNSWANPSHRSLSRRQWAGTSTRAETRAESSALFVLARGTKQFVRWPFKKKHTPTSEWLISSSSFCKKKAFTNIYRRTETCVGCCLSLLSFFFCL